MKDADLENFTKWMHLKEQLSSAGGTHSFREGGELWWAALGENVGIEANGENNIPQLSLTGGGRLFAELCFNYSKKYWKKQEVCDIMGVRVSAGLGLL